MLLGAFVIGGCTSLDWAVSDVTGEEHVVVYNRGYYLFNAIPLFSKTGVFRDDVTPEKEQARLMEWAKKRNKSVYDLCYNNYNSVFFDIPILGFSIPIPYILTTKEVQLSGVMK